MHQLSLLSVLCSCTYDYQRSSNRAPVQQEADTSGQLVTREMQDFLSRKLSEFLDRLVKIKLRR